MLLKKFSRLEFCLILLLILIVTVLVYFDINIPICVSKIINKVSSFENINIESLKLLLFCLGSFICNILIIVISSYVSSSYIARLRKTIYQKIITFSNTEVKHFKTSSLISRSLNDTLFIRMFIFFILRVIFYTPLMIVFASIKLNSLSKTITIAIIFSITFLSFITAIVFQIATKKVQIVQKTTDNINNIIQENITGLKQVYASNSTLYQIDKFEKQNAVIGRTNLFINRLLGVLNPMYLLFSNLLIVLIYYVGSKLLINKEIEIGTIIAYTMLMLQVFTSFILLIMFSRLFPRVVVSTKRIKEVLLTKPSITNSLNPVFITEIKSIEFKDVSFKYLDAECECLSNISFKVTKGEKVGIIGPMGCGKSTLISLITRLNDVSSGSIYINDINIKEIDLDSLHSLIGLNPHEPTNITDKLSLGEKYFVNITSALTKPVIILDDTFSSLDKNSISNLQNDIKYKTDDKIIIIASSKISNLKSATKIIVLDKGKISGIGTKDHLIETNSLFKNMYDLSKSVYDE